MNIALAGLTAREEVALGMLVGKALPGWQCLPPTDGPKTPLPPADLYVVDLAGRGMVRWTEAAQRGLLDSLRGAPAVLVAAAFDETWSALDAHPIQGQPLVLLHKPYGVEAMRVALQKAAAGRPVPAPSIALEVKKLTAPGTARLSEARRVLRPSLPTAAVRTSPPARVRPVSSVRPAKAEPPLVESTLTCSEFQAQMAPLSGQPFFLRRLAESLTQQQPFELRISFVNRMIFHPAEQWAASNTPAPVLQQLCDDDALALGVEIDPINTQDALVRAARLGISAQPLQVLLWKLAHDFAVSKPSI